VKLKKHDVKKEEKKLSKISKPGLIFQIHNLWNPRLMLNEEAQLSTNKIMEHEIVKKGINQEKNFQEKKYSK